MGLFLKWLKVREGWSGNYWDSSGLSGRDNPEIAPPRDLPDSIVKKLGNSMQIRQKAREIVKALPTGFVFKWPKGLYDELAGQQAEFVKLQDQFAWLKIGGKMKRVSLIRLYQILCDLGYCN